MHERTSDAVELATLIHCLVHLDNTGQCTYRRTSSEACDMMQHARLGDARSTRRLGSTFELRFKLDRVGRSTLTARTVLGVQRKPVPVLRRPLSARKLSMTSGQSSHVPVSPPRRQKRRRHSFSPRRQNLGDFRPSVVLLLELSSAHFSNARVEHSLHPAVVETFRYA